MFGHINLHFNKGKQKKAILLIYTSTVICLIEIKDTASQTGNNSLFVFQTESQSHLSAIDCCCI